MEEFKNMTSWQMYEAGGAHYCACTAILTLMISVKCLRAICVVCFRLTGEDMQFAIERLQLRHKNT